MGTRCFLLKRMNHRNQRRDIILDAKTNLGTVSNLFANSYAGEGPRAILHLHTHLGTISVKPM